MRKRFFFVFLSVIFCHLIVFFLRDSFFFKKIPVFCFHQVLAQDSLEFQNPQTRFTAITHQRFFEILQIIESFGAKYVLPGAAPVPGENQVMLTFDDGTRDHWQQIMPLLKKKNIPALFFFLSANATTEKKSQFFKNELQNSDLRYSGIQSAMLLHTHNRLDSDRQEIIKNLDYHQIGSHSTVHEPLTMLPEKEIETRLRKSHDQLVLEFSRPVTSFAFPEGEFNEFSAKKAMEIYPYCFTVEADYFYPQNKRLHGRFMIFPKTSDEEIVAYLRSGFSTFLWPLIFLAVLDLFFLLYSKRFVTIQLKGFLSKRLV